MSGEEKSDEAIGWPMDRLLTQDRCDQLLESARAFAVLADQADDSEEGARQLIYWLASADPILAQWLVDEAMHAGAFLHSMDEALRAGTLLHGRTATVTVRIRAAARWMVSVLDTEHATTVLAEIIRSRR